MARSSSVSGFDIGNSTTGFLTTSTRRRRGHGGRGEQIYVLTLFVENIELQVCHGKRFELAVSASGCSHGQLKSLPVTHSHHFYRASVRPSLRSPCPLR